MASILKFESELKKSRVNEKKEAFFHVIFNYSYFSLFFD